jgi:2-polyprenyl-3-methyl-5-hydroxy-6-metoxy-1,4-benzoquinol methylase
LSERVLGYSAHLGKRNSHIEYGCSLCHFDRNTYADIFKYSLLCVYRIRLQIANRGDLLMKNSAEELFWKKDNGNLIFGGKPVAHNGKEFGLKARLGMLKNFEVGNMILSVGCGLAAELRLLTKQGYITIGLDPERNFLLAAKKTKNAQDFVQATGESTPFCAKCFDLILFFEVLEHVKNPEMALREINEILKPGGKLLLTVPNRFYILETHGIQGSEKQVIHLWGLGLPLLSMMPYFLRKRFERARIFSQAKLVTLLRKNRLEPIKIRYLMPPLDIFKQTPLILATRRVLFHLSFVPLIKMLGMSIMILCIKK